MRTPYAREARAYGVRALNRWPSLRLVLDASNVLDQQRPVSLRWICTTTEGS